MNSNRRKPHFSVKCFIRLNKTPFRKLMFYPWSKFNGFFYQILWNPRETMSSFYLFVLTLHKTVEWPRFLMSICETNSTPFYQISVSYDIILKTLRSSVKTSCPHIIQFLFWRYLPLIRYYITRVSYIIFKKTDTLGMPSCPPNIQIYT